LRYDPSTFPQPLEDQNQSIYLDQINFNFQKVEKKAVLTSHHAARVAKISTVQYLFLFVKDSRCAQMWELIHQSVCILTSQRGEELNMEEEEEEEEEQNRLTVPTI